MKEIAQITSLTGFHAKSSKTAKKLEFSPSDKPQWKYGPQMSKVTKQLPVLSPYEYIRMYSVTELLRSLHSAFSYMEDFSS